MDILLMVGTLAFQKCPLEELVGGVASLKPLGFVAPKCHARRHHHETLLRLVVCYVANERRRTN